MKRQRDRLIQGIYVVFIAAALTGGTTTSPYFVDHFSRLQLLELIALSLLGMCAHEDAVLTERLDSIKNSGVKDT